MWWCCWVPNMCNRPPSITIRCCVCHRALCEALASLSRRASFVQPIYVHNSNRNKWYFHYKLLHFFLRFFIHLSVAVRSRDATVKLMLRKNQVKSICVERRDNKGTPLLLSASIPLMRRGCSVRTHATNIRYEYKLIFIGFSWIDFIIPVQLATPSAPRLSMYDAMMRPCLCCTFGFYAR